MRSTARTTGVDGETVGTLLERVDEGCEALLNDAMVNLPCTRLELDELWAFVGKKQRHMKAGDAIGVGGDTWTWLALDAETKLVPSFLVGKRTVADARAFVADLAKRLSTRVQLSTDGLRSYIIAMGASFGTTGMDYAQVMKSYEAEMHVASTTLTLAAYNFTRQHKMLRCSPAMAAGLSRTLSSADELVSAALDGVRP